LISSILTLNNKGIVILAQSNTSTNSTSSSQSDDQTTGVEPNPRSNLTQSDKTDRDGDGILDSIEIPIDTKPGNTDTNWDEILKSNPTIPDYNDEFIYPTKTYSLSISSNTNSNPYLFLYDCYIDLKQICSCFLRTRNKVVHLLPPVPYSRHIVVRL